MSDRALADKLPTPPASGDGVAYWTWSGMVDYDDPDLSTGHGHAGGPGTYGAFTFSGTGVDVFAVKSPTVTVAQRAHRTGKVKISIDGKEKDTVDLAASDKDPHFKIASIGGLSSGNHVLEVEPVGGWIVIDSAKIVDGLPTSVAAAPVRAAEKHLVGYWPFDEGKGASVADKSGNGHTGYLQAGAAWTPDHKPGNLAAVSFPSAGGVEIANPVIDTAHSFTVSAWVKLANTDGYQTFVSADGGTVSGFYLQLSRDTGKFAFTRLVSDSHSDGVRADATDGPQTGVWYNLTGAYNESQHVIALFVNGQFQSASPFNSPWHASGPLAIGRGKYDGSYVDFTTAEIDDVRVYDTALSPAAIMSIYDNGH